MSIGKLHSLSSDLFPEFVQFDENFFEKTIDFFCWLWYTIREVKGRGQHPPRKKLKNFKKTLDKPPKVWYNKYIRLRETNGKPQSIKRNEVIKNGKENNVLHD